MHHVIIGNSTAAIAAVESIRAVDAKAELSVISRENYYCYSRPLISYYLAGKTELKNIYYRSQDFYTVNKVNLHLGRKVTEIDVINKKINMEVSPLSFDKLLIATGSVPVIPDVFKGEFSNLFTFHSLDDVVKIKHFINGGKKLKVVVAGGGLIGLKAAESLTRTGQEVTIIETADYILNSILDIKAAHLITSHLESQAVRILCASRTVKVIAQGQQINNIILENGEVISCDLLVVAAGMKPAVPQVIGAELETDKGIVVDEFMQTSLADVYAAGDAAQGLDKITRSKKLIPTLPSAYHQGHIAGLNMAGQKTADKGQIAFNSIPLFGLTIYTAGISNADGTDYEYLTVKHDRGQYRKLIIKEDTVQGFIFIGEAHRAGIYRNLIEKKADISLIKPRLLADSFGLADLPIEFSREVFL